MDAASNETLVHAGTWLAYGSLARRLLPKRSPRHNAVTGIDVATEKPPAANSPLRGIEQVATTLHTAGEARRYDDNMIVILRDDLAAFAAKE